MSGTPFGSTTPTATPAARQAARAERGADIVVYGHSHRREAAVEGGVLYLNPGSPTASRGRGLSAAILAMEAGEVAVRFIEPDSP